MSIRYLGTHFDIHTGGVDHIPVHHTNEIAQSECAFDVHPWVNVWMHNEFLDLGGEKLSKSKGHTLVLDDLVERGFEPLAYRYFFLQAHYRQQQAFSWEEMDAAATGYRRLLRAAVAVRDAAGEPAGGEGARDRGAAHALLGRGARRPERAARARGGVGGGAQRALAAGAARAAASSSTRWLGLGLATRGAARRRAARAIRASTRWSPSARRAHRRATSPRADRIRAELDAEGIEIEDGKDGSKWRRVQ